MPKIKIRFFYKDQIISFEYEESCTIEEMLKDFLRQTHSKMTLDPEEIMFIYKSRILNKERYLLNKTVSFHMTCSSTMKASDEWALLFEVTEAFAHPTPFLGMPFWFFFVVFGEVGQPLVLCSSLFFYFLYFQMLIF